MKKEYLYLLGGIALGVAGVKFGVADKLFGNYRKTAIRSEVRPGGGYISEKMCGAGGGKSASHRGVKYCKGGSQNMKRITH